MLQPQSFLFNINILVFHRKDTKNICYFPVAKKYRRMHKEDELSPLKEHNLRNWLSGMNSYLFWPQMGKVSDLTGVNNILSLTWGGNILSLQAAVPQRRLAH